MQGAGNAPSLSLTKAAMLLMLRCVVLRLLSPHPLVCRVGGLTPLIWAAKRGHESIVHLLLEYLADVNAVNG
jgi:hypothetical protein